MEVRPGYKQTEVGVIPEEWDVEPLGEICDSSRTASRAATSITKRVDTRRRDLFDGRIDIWRCD